MQWKWLQNVWNFLPQHGHNTSSMTEKGWRFLFSASAFPQVSCFQQQCTSSCWQVQPQLSNTVLRRSQNPCCRHQKGTCTLPVPGCRKAVWLTWCDTAPLPRHSLCGMVSLAIRQAVWMGCHRHWEISKKVKSETEKEVMSYGPTCINVVWERLLILCFRWCWHTEDQAMDMLTFLLRTDVCSQ